MANETRIGAQQMKSALSALSDEEVVRRVRDGDRALFEVLMRRHNQRVYRAIRSILRDEHEVEDAMQQAWLHAFSHLDQFEGASAFSTWLTRIALNEGLARLRQRGRVTPFAEVPEQEIHAMRNAPVDPEGRVSDRELGRMIELAVDALPDLYRSVFVLREIQGLSTADAAECLGVSEEVVKVRLHRARLALRDALFERARESSSEAFTFMGERCDRMVARVFAALPAGA